jgi:hypothetical protein
MQGSGAPPAGRAWREILATCSLFCPAFSGASSTVCPSVGGGSFRIHGVPLTPNEPWWPNPDDSPDTIERAALHSYWDDKPRERLLMLEEAERLRRTNSG